MFSYCCLKKLWKAVNSLSFFGIFCFGHVIYQIQLRHLHQRIVEDKNSEIGKHLFAAFSKPTEISNKSSYSLFAGGRCCCYGERWIIRRHISLSIYCCCIYNLGQNRWEICNNPPPQINDEKMARFGFYAASSSIWGGGGGVMGVCCTILFCSRLSVSFDWRYSQRQV